MKITLAPLLVLLATLCLESCGTLGDLTLVGLQAQKAQDELRLVATYKSSKDLSQFDRTMLWGNFFLCEHSDAHLRLGPIHQDHVSNPAAPPEKLGSPPYTAIFRAALTEGVHSNPPYESFDLRRQPQDVCFRLKQGPYSESGASSGVLVIPKEKIASAISQSETIGK